MDNYLPVSVSAGYLGLLHMLSVWKIYVLA